MLILDRVNLDTKRTFTREGYLIVPSLIARTGIQVYYASELGATDREPTEVVKVYRPPEEVFKEESLQSFSNKPVTNDHPPELVNATNFKKYSVGISSESISREGDYVAAELSIMDEKAISDIKSGKCELSNGYVSDIDWTEGVTPEGEQYDCIQRNIIGNHIAIVEKGRAGFACRVADNSPSIEDQTMPTILIDGVSYEATEQTVQAVGKLQARLSDADKEISEKEDELKKKEDEMESAEAEAKKTEDSLKAQLDDAKSKIPTATSLDALVTSRQTLVADALKISPDYQWEGKEASVIRKEIVSDNCANIPEDASDDYIAARFDALLASAPENVLDSALLGKNTNKSEDVPTVDAARAKFAEQQRHAWKGDK